MERNIQIDMLKGFAIVSVILTHSLPLPIFLLIGSPFYIKQAVPIFLILAGYNGVRSYMRHGAERLSQCYSWASLSLKLYRLLRPLVVIWIIQAFILKVILNANFSIREWIVSFIVGGWGPGSYFFPIMIQVVLVLPLLYLLALRNVTGMLILSFILDMAFDLWGFATGMPELRYSLLIPRYLFAVGLGIWLAMAKKPDRIVVGAIVSVVYITAVEYFGFKLPVEPTWGSQNAPSFLWAFVIVLIGLKAPGLRFPVLAKLGEASYHIFLAQKFYFWAASFGLIGVSRGLPIALIAIAEVFICVSMGLTFYWFDTLRPLKLAKMPNLVPWLSNIKRS